MPRTSGMLWFGLLVLLPGAEAAAWTDATRLRMLDDALKVSPPALARILRHNEAALRRGMIEPSAHEDEEIHFQHPDGRQGLAAAAVDRKTREIASLLMEKRSLKRFAYEMGVLAHLLADAGFTLNASDADPREPLYREGWRRYVEQQLPKIPFVFDREPSKHLKKQDYRGAVLAEARRAAANYPAIGPAFKDDGTPRSRDAVDERSLAFGVASLSYSHAASSIAWVWLDVWRSLNGDLEGTPALNLPPARKAEIPPRPRKTGVPVPAEKPAAGAPAPGGATAAGKDPAPEGAEDPR
jgi:hypothetical protein